MIQQTDKQRRTLVRSYVEHTLKGRSMDAIEVSREIEKHWGVGIDWHLIEYLLDEMVGYGAAQRDGFGPDRMTKYFIRYHYEEPAR